MSSDRFLRVAVDLFVVTMAAAVGSALELARPDHDGWVIAAQVVAALVLLVRRRRPYTAALTIAAISLFAPAWAAVLVPYSVTAFGSGQPWRRWGVIAALAGAFLIGARAWAIDDPFTAPMVILFSALLGLYFRTRRGLVAELTDRVERAERERLLLAEQARADERVKLAGEMHDAVTHRINLMVLQAGALRVSTTDPAARKAAEEMRVAGCEALTELRDLVGVLRGGPPGDTAAGAGAPAEPGLSELVTESCAVGLPVRLVEEGDPATVAPTVRRTLFRVVQESLTNVHKHAPGADATVSVRYDQTSVHATVSNTRRRRPADPDVTAAGGGSGLDGLKYRVEVVGGTLTARPEPDGGFTVSAIMPAFVAAT